jgi:hypothetical protein
VFKSLWGPSLPYGEALRLRDALVRGFTCVATSGKMRSRVGLSYFHVR